MGNQINTSSDGMLSLPAIVDIAKAYNLSPKAFAYTFRSVAMPDPHTEAEFVSCCLVAREHGLNPLTKEIYFIRTKAGVIQPIVSVDGWIKKCNEHPMFDGLDIEDDRNASGALVGMYCTIYRKDRSRPTRIREDLAECKSAGGAAWKTSEYRMMRNRTICQCARIAFGFAGIMERDEFDQWQAMTDAPQKTARIVDAEIPEIPDDDVPAIPDDDDSTDIIDPFDTRPMSPEQEEHYLAELKADLATAKSSEIRAEVIDAFLPTIEQMSDANRRQAEAIIDGRA